MISISLTTKNIAQGLDYSVQPHGLRWAASYNISEVSWESSDIITAGEKWYTDLGGIMEMENITRHGRQPSKASNDNKKLLGAVFIIVFGE